MKKGKTDTTAYEAYRELTNKTEWKPVNPCEGCEYKEDWAHCFTECCKYAKYVGGKQTLIAYTKWLIEKTDCYEIPYGGIPKVELDSILKELKAI